MERKPRTLAEAVRMYGDADYALAEAIQSRWPGGVICVQCGAGKPLFLTTRRIWKCGECKRQFSVKSGTLLENSPLGLDRWLVAFWMIANDPEGGNSHQLARALGVTRKTAWLMLHRARLAVPEPSRNRNQP